MISVENEGKILQANWTQYLLWILQIHSSILCYVHSMNIHTTVPWSCEFSNSESINTIYLNPSWSSVQGV